MKMKLDNTLFIIFYSILNLFYRKVFLLLNGFYNKIYFKKKINTLFKLNLFIIKSLIQ